MAIDSSAHQHGAAGHGASLTAHERNGGRRENGMERKPTNAEKIRAMSEEALAEFFLQDIGLLFCKEIKNCIDKAVEEVDCKKCVLAWLRQRAQ